LWEKALFIRNCRAAAVLRTSSDREANEPYGPFSEEREPFIDVNDVRRFQVERFARLAFQREFQVQLEVSDLALFAANDHHCLEVRLRVIKAASFHDGLERGNRAGGHDSARSEHCAGHKDGEGGRFQGDHDFLELQLGPVNLEQIRLEFSWSLAHSLQLAARGQGHLAVTPDLLRSVEVGRAGKGDPDRGAFPKDDRIG
jgi:hypothetical protein